MTMKSEQSQSSTSPAAQPRRGRSATVIVKPVVLNSEEPARRQSMRIRRHSLKLGALEPQQGPRNAGTGKKQRATVACLACRVYKRKCSGGRPCALCIQRKRGEDCRYDQDTPPTPTVAVKRKRRFVVSGRLKTPGAVTEGKVGSKAGARASRRTPADQGDVKMLTRRVKVSHISTQEIIEPSTMTRRTPETQTEVPAFEGHIPVPHPRSAIYGQDIWSSIPASDGVHRPYYYPYATAPFMTYRPPPPPAVPSGHRTEYHTAGAPFSATHAPYSQSSYTYGSTSWPPRRVSDQPTYTLATINEPYRSLPPTPFDPPRLVYNSYERSAAQAPPMTSGGH